MVPTTRISGKFCWPLGYSSATGLWRWWRRPTRDWKISGGSARVSQDPARAVQEGRERGMDPLMRIQSDPDTQAATGGGTSSTGSSSIRPKRAAADAADPRGRHRCGVRGRRACPPPRPHDPIRGAPDCGCADAGSAPRPALVRLPSSGRAPAAKHRPARRVIEIGPRRQGEIKSARGEHSAAVGLPKQGSNASSLIDVHPSMPRHARHMG